MNSWGSRRQAFLFGIDFGVANGFFLDPAEAGKLGIYFNINGTGNETESFVPHIPVKLKKYPVDPDTYNRSFDLVHRNLVAGNSYLTNLTFPTPVELNVSLPEIFARSKARYRMLFRDQFVVFSPEIFVQIQAGTIRSFPMKGTIDASIADAEKSILSNHKETAEHNTIVDLIRNDLSMVAKDVKVERFRYIEKIVTHEKTLLQVSSEISGQLPSDYSAHFGDIFETLLPAGSISGAPKKKTLQIIDEAEISQRGYYTGIFGYYDGVKLDSGVMIRFIKNENGKLTFFSGGGITANSVAETEYNELIDKVYVPFS